MICSNLRCLGSNLRCLASTLIELKFALKRTQEFFNLCHQKGAEERSGARARPVLKWLSCYLSLTCIYVQVRLATHPKSVFGSSALFLTCVDLHLRLTGAFECAYDEGLEVNFRRKLYLLRYGIYFFVNCTEPSADDCTEASAQLIST